MSKQLTMKAGVAIFAALALAVALAIMTFGAYQPVAAQTTSDDVTRSFNTNQVTPGGTLDVTITLNTGLLVEVTETLPVGWTYQSVMPSDVNVSESGQTITFNVITGESVTYTVMAPTMADSGTFSGMYSVPNGASNVMVGGDTAVIVATAGSTPSEISSLAVSPTSAKPGEAVTVTGMGLPANATAHIFLENMKVTSATISDSGSFAAAFIVPDGALGGSNTVAARASASATENMATATLMVEPDFRGFYDMAMDGSKVMYINNDVSNTIYADIRGFGAGNVMFTAMGADGESVTLGSGSGQRVELTIGAGALAAGNAAITATQGSLSDMMYLEVVTPAITLSAPPMDNSRAFDIIVTGTNFGPGPTVSITVTGADVSAASSALSMGGFEKEITLPAGAGPGTITITAATSAGHMDMASFMLAPAPPAQVTGVIVTPGTGSLGVTWAQVSAVSTTTEKRPAADGYKVEWKMVSTAAWDAEDMAMVVGNDQTYHLISGLTPGQPYMVRVSAMTGGTAGMVSGINSDAVGTPLALPVGLTVPGLVQNMDVSAISHTELFVSWNAPENNGGSAITGYSVQYRKFGATSWTDVTRTGAGVGQEIAKLEDDTAYQVQVAATNSAGAGSYAKDTGRTDAAPAVVTSLDNTLPKSFEAVSSDTPGAAVRVTLKAKLAVALDGEIAVKLDKFGLPDSIDDDEVTIRSNDGELHYQGNPTSVTISGSTVTLTLGTLKGLTETSKSLIDLASDKVTIITIQQGAGITNPTAAKVYDLEVGSDTATNKATVNRKVTVKPTSGARGSEITVTGKGFGTGTATIELGTGDVLESNVAIEDGSFEKVLTVGDDFAAGANTINAVDGAGDRASKDNDAEFTVKAKITADPEEVTPAQEMTIKVSDWSAGAVTEVNFGGIVVKSLTGNTTSASSTKGQFKFIVPANARVGVNKVSLRVGKEDEGSVNVTVKALGLTIDLTTVVPGQRLTITGTDFAKNTNVTLIMIGGKEAELPATDDRASTSTGRIAYTVTVPLDVGNGDKKVEVTVGAKKGIGAVVVPKPTITVTPEVSAPGTVISVEGSGFASGKRIEVLYDGAIEEVGRADSSGGFTIRMDVPSDAGIGTTSDVKVEVRGTASINATAEHKTPGSMIALPESAQVGTRITISGSNFEPFSVLREVTVGGTDALPSPAPETDKNGAFSFEIRVPRLTPGNHTVTVKDGSNARNSATETFAVVTTPTVSAPAEVFGSLGDKLLVVWRFDNATSSWASYDPNAPAELNDLTGVSRGDIVWVEVTENVMFQGSTLYAGWNLISLE